MGYNPAGQIASHSRDNDNYAWTGHYATNRAYTANGRNQYTAAGSASFTYDANGNLTSDGERTWLYDNENRLVGAGAATLAYDPLGRLFSLTSGSTTTTFLFDGGNLVAEYEGSTMLRRHVHWDGTDAPAVTFDGAGLTQPHWLHADERGTIVASSDGNGAATINRYDEYGLPASANTGRFGFTGQLWLPEIGLYYYRARIYSPTLGRFMQTDPIGHQGGMNLYAYVRNDPINFTDPTGLIDWKRVFEAGYWGAIEGGLTGGVTGCIGGALVGSAAGGVGAGPGCVAGAPVGFLVGLGFGAAYMSLDEIARQRAESYRRRRDERAQRAGEQIPRTGANTNGPVNHFIDPGYVIPHLYVYSDFIIDFRRELFGPLNTIGLITYLIKCIVGDVDICEGLEGVFTRNQRSLSEHSSSGE